MRFGKPRKNIRRNNPRYFTVTENLKVENNSNKNMHDVQFYLEEFYPFAKKALGFEQDATVVFESDLKNSKNPLGKTAHYNPAVNTVTVYVDNRHPKDVMRSVSHELVHHAQNLRGDLGGGAMEEGYAQNDDHLRKMEEEAYRKGNMVFRDWTDTRNNPGGQDNVMSRLMQEWGYDDEAITEDSEKFEEGQLVVVVASALAVDGEKTGTVVKSDGNAVTIKLDDDQEGKHVPEDKMVKVKTDYVEARAEAGFDDTMGETKEVNEMYDDDYDDFDMGALEDEFPWLAKSVKTKEVPAELAAELAAEFGDKEEPEEEEEEVVVMKEKGFHGSDEEKEMTAKMSNKEFSDYHTGDKYISPDLKGDMGEIPGMEGPFQFKSGAVLYYDNKTGEYYDRGKDMYLDRDEAAKLTMEEGMGGDPRRDFMDDMIARTDLYPDGVDDDGETLTMNYGPGVFGAEISIGPDGRPAISIAGDLISDPDEAARILDAHAKDMLTMEENMGGETGENWDDLLSQIMNNSSDADAAEMAEKAYDLVEAGNIEAATDLIADIMNHTSDPDTSEAAEKAYDAVEAQGGVNERKGVDHKKAAWMKAYNDAAGNPQPPPQDFWDTATYLYNRGDDPYEAGNSYAARSERDQGAEDPMDDFNYQGSSHHYQESINEGQKTWAEYGADDAQKGRPASPPAPGGLSPDKREWHEYMEAYKAAAGQTVGGSTGAHMNEMEGDGDGWGEIHGNASEEAPTMDAAVNALSKLDKAIESYLQNVDKFPQYEADARDLQEIRGMFWQEIKNGATPGNFSQELKDVVANLDTIVRDEIPQELYYSLHPEILENKKMELEEMVRQAVRTALKEKKYRREDEKEEVDEMKYRREDDKSQEAEEEEEESVDEALSAAQKELDVDGDGDIEGDDLAGLRSGKNADDDEEKVDELTNKEWYDSNLFENLMKKWAN